MDTAADLSAGDGRLGEGATLELLRSGSLFADRFEIVQPAAAGGMGVVYRARDRQTGAEVALKTLRSHFGPLDSLRFEREARLLAELDHPAVVRHVAHGHDRGVPYLVMEWLQGESLAKRLDRGPLSLREVLTLALRVAEALALAHGQGLVHRDIKPSNLFLVDGKCESAKVLDFGLARSELAPREVTQTGFVLGSPGYISPEQALGRREIDARADVFALGCVIFECLTGRTAFGGDSALQALSNVLLTTPVRVAQLAPATPAALDGLVFSMLAKEPDERPADGSEVVLALRTLGPDGRGEAQGPGAVFEHRAQRLLDGPAGLVWALMTDSNRWNRLIGSPPSRYQYGPVPGSLGERVDGPARIGEAEVLGVPSRWLELGEWVEGARTWGERRFLEGLFQAIRFDFEVADATTGDRPATRLSITLTATATASVPADAGQFLIGHLQKRLDRYFKALDGLLAGASAPPGSEPPAAQARWLLLSTDDRALVGPAGGLDENELAARRARLPQAPEPAVAAALAHLVTFLRQRPDDQVAQIRPLECARLWGCERSATVLGFLAATRAGLLELRWQLRCPVCRVAAGHARSLRTVQNEGHCESCQTHFPLDLSSTVEGVFAIHPALRTVTPVVYCASSPIFRPHVFASLMLQPGETRELLCVLPDQDLALRAPRQPRAARLPACDRASDLRVELRDDGPVLLAGSPPATEVPPGQTRLTLSNPTVRPVTLLLERTVPERDVLLATELLLWPGFGAQFADEVPAEGVELQVSSVTLVSAELCGVDALCRQAGDAAAATTVMRARRALRRLVEAGGGSVTQMLGDRLLASFGRHSAGLQAAQAMVTEAGTNLSVRAAILEGSCVAIQADDRLELFGRALGEVSRAMERASPREVVVAA